MANDIVTINVSTQFAPAPDNLQKIGAFVSQGGTNTSPGTLTILTQVADLTPILSASIAITAATWASNLVTITLSTVHGIPSGETVTWTIAGMVPAGYNGTYQVTATGPNTFTYPLSVNPGTATTFGTAVDASNAEVLSMATTYFANGNTNAVYVLELGEGNTANGVSDLTTWIANNPNQVYGFIVPRSWATEPSFPALVNAQSGNTALTYFFITFNSSNYANASSFAGYKAAFLFVESVNVAANEFSVAAPFFVILNRSPSNVNKVPPLQYAFLVGVTAGPWNGTQRAAFKAAFLNFADTGAEGGITNTILKGGVVGTGLYYNFWYSTDWAIINLHLNLANTIINGSNNVINPLYYNQQGINRLQATAQQTVNSGISFGLFLAPGVVNAVDFLTYTTDNPSDYAIGEYDGLSATLTPQNGFTHIIFNLTVTDIVAG
jgi:hypothetical protein